MPDTYKKTHRFIPFTEKIKRVQVLQFRVEAPLNELKSLTRFPDSVSR